MDVCLKGDESRNIADMVFLKLFCLLAAFGAVCTEATNVEHAPLQIVNGTQAKEGEIPYIVQLRESDYHRFTCGGAIISEKWIITAAHCVSEKSMDIVYGTTVLANVLNSNLSVPVISKRTHPKYYYLHGSIPLYDVGILELGDYLNFSATVQPVKLPEANAETPIHVDGTLAGWGLSASGPYVAMDNLQKISLQLLSDSECSDRMKADADFDDFPAGQNYCSDDHFNGECNGDSGSPFVIDNTAYGLVSWSFKPCGTSPGTYTRLTNPEIRQYIKDITGI